MPVSGRARRALALSLFFILMMTTTTKCVVAVTWSVNLTRMTTALFFDGLPAITQTADGRIWIVWAKAVLGDNTIFHTISSDLGATWSPEKSLTYIPTQILGRHDTNPSITQAANGTIWLVWASNKPPPDPDFSMEASPEALTIPQGSSNTSTIIITSLYDFSEPVSLSTKSPIAGVSTAFDPSQVTPPPNDTANSILTISVAPTATPGNYTLTVVGKSGTLEHRVGIALEIVPLGTATLNDAPSSSTTPLSEYEMDYEIFYKTSGDNGATWSDRVQLTDNPIGDLGPSILQLKNGTIMVVHQTELDGNPEIFYNATLDGTSWTYGNITADPGFDKGPSIMQADDERIWVVWTSDRTGDFEIFSKTHDGASWSDATQLTYSTDDDTNPSIVQTVDGTIWLFWTSRGTSPTATGDIYYKFSTDNGATWSDPVQFTTDNNEDLWPTVAETRDTRLWVLWTSNRADQPDGNWDVYYRTSLVGDVNGDGVVDIYDLSLVGKAYGAVVGQPAYNPDVDITKDGRVDIRDIALVSRNWGAT